MGASQPGRGGGCRCGWTPTPSSRQAGSGEERVKQGAPELAGVVSDVKWQKYDAICHVVLPLRAGRE